MYIYICVFVCRQQTAMQKSKFWGGDSDSESEEEENDDGEFSDEKKPAGVSKYMDSDDDEFQDDEKRVVKSAKAKRAELLNELSDTLKSAIDNKQFADLSDGVCVYMYMCMCSDATRHDVVFALSVALVTVLALRAARRKTCDAARVDAIFVCFFGV